MYGYIDSVWAAKGLMTSTNLEFLIASGTKEQLEQIALEARASFDGRCSACFGCLFALMAEVD